MSLPQHTFVRAEGMKLESDLLHAPSEKAVQVLERPRIRDYRIHFHLCKSRFSWLTGQHLLFLTLSQEICSFSLALANNSFLTPLHHRHRMSTLLRSKGLAAIAALCIVLPTFLLSQVTIRERVQIKPRSPDKQTTAIQRPARTADASDIFYDPPLFVEDPLSHRTGATLPGTITITGTVDIAGSIGTNQHALLIYSDPSGADHEIAAKGRDAIGFGGNMYERQTPFTGPLNKGLFPSIGLYLFDSQWVTRIGEVTMDGNTLTWTFSGLLDQHTLPAAPVTATATLTGSFLPDVQFDHWEILAEDMTVTGHDSTWVRFAPMDGTADPGEFSMLSIYRPWGISPSEAGITARVDAEGEYAFLAYNEFVEGGNSPYHSGQELTMSLKYTPFLVYADSLGTFNGSTETVGITVTGGGKSATVPVVLTKNEILLGETKYYYVAAVDGTLKIKETESTSEPEDLVPGFEWGDEPVEVVESSPNSGKRLGVYWETGKPIPNATGTLPDALIRLIGRYWHADSLYKVRLSATDSYGESVSTVIQVEKPVALIDWENEDVRNGVDFRNRNDYSLTNDVFGRPLNVDELILELAGRTGIPPQIVKGQMYKESDKSMNRFNPTYRYEPFFDYPRQFASLGKKWKDPYIQQPFFVTTDGMGSGKTIPTDHSNTRPMKYPTTPMLISKFLLDNWNYYTRGRETENFALVGSTNFTILWRLFLQEAKKAGWPSNLAIELATGELKLTLTERLTSFYAQTRKASSYSFLQMMYTTALMHGYNRGKDVTTSDAPESLNDHNILLPFYESFTLSNLKSQFGTGTSVVPESRWQPGFEKTWEKALDLYNKKEDNCGKIVLTHSLKFKPSSQ
jgi:hypothetical protein